MTPAKVAMQQTNIPATGFPRTTGRMSAPVCEGCGKVVEGRRRNGFCSDRCRMAARRQRITAERVALVGELRRTLEAIERELLGGAGTTPDGNHGDA